jgi:hypothetical protein
VALVNKLHPSALLSVCALESLLMNHSGRTYLIRVTLMTATGFVAYPSETLVNINMIGSLSKLNHLIPLLVLMYLIINSKDKEISLGFDRLINTVSRLK